LVKLKNTAIKTRIVLNECVCADTSRGLAQDQSQYPSVLRLPGGLTAISQQFEYGCPTVAVLQAAASAVEKSVLKERKATTREAVIVGEVPKEGREHWEILVSSTVYFIQLAEKTPNSNFSQKQQPDNSETWKNVTWLSGSTCCNVECALCACKLAIKTPLDLLFPSYSLAKAR